MKKRFYFPLTLLLFATFPFCLHFVVYLFLKIDVKKDIIYLSGIAVGAFVLTVSSLTFPKVIYIFFHELSHSLFALLSKGKVFEFKVGTESGYIKSDKDNLFIRLAPYFFPLTNFIVVIIFYLTLSFIATYTKISPHLIFKIFWFILCYVILLTTYYNIKLMRQETSDIDAKMQVLSLIFIMDLYFPLLVFSIYIMAIYEKFLVILPKG